jgi:hypothetical protein
MQLNFLLLNPFLTENFCNLNASARIELKIFAYDFRNIEISNVLSSPKILAIHFMDQYLYKTLF